MEVINVTSFKEIVRFQKELEANNYLALDIESNSLDPFTMDILCIQIKMENFYFISRDGLKKQYITYLLELIESSGKKVVGHNIVFDIVPLKINYNVLLTNLYDTMLGEVLINQGIGKKFYSLEELVDKYYHISLNKEIRKQFEGAYFLTDEMINYALDDVKYLIDIMNLQLPQLENQSKVLEVEMQLIPVVASMKIKGIYLNVDKLNTIIQKASGEAVDIQSELKELLVELLLNIKIEIPIDEFITDKLGIQVPKKDDLSQLYKLEDLSIISNYLKTHININSPIQMKKILNFIGIGVKDTNEKTLRDFMAYKPVSLLLDYREKFKKVSAFGNSLTENIHIVTGRIHATLNQLATDTGRFSCAKPNLQQIPRESDFRAAFEAEEGHVLVTVDFAQQELRIAAALSREPKMLDAFNKGIDLHSLTASLVYNVPIEEITKDDSRRQIAKSINFASLYGTSAFGLARNFGIPVDEGEELLDRYWKSYPVLAKFIEALRERVIKACYSATPLGRRRYFERKTFFADSKEMYQYIGSMGRQGANHPIQGAGADTTKISLINIFRESQKYGEKFGLVVPVHDEIVAEVTEDIAEESLELMKSCMLAAEELFLKGLVPAAVSGKISKTWQH